VVCELTRRALLQAAAAALLPGREIRLAGGDWTVAPFEPGKGVEAGAFAGGYPLQAAIPAIVPGDIHWDLERAGRIPNIHYGLNSREAAWVAAKEWWYRKVFAVPRAWRDKSVRLHFDGVDYLCDVWMNGQHLGRHEGQFTPFELDLSGRLRYPGPNTLAVLIHPVPESVQRVVAAWSDPRKFESQSGEWPLMQAMRAAYPCWKSMTSSGWDWGAKLLTMGIWKDVRLVASDGAHLANLAVLTDLPRPYDRARIRVRVTAQMEREEPADLVCTVACLTAKAAPHTNRKRIAGSGEHELTLEIPNPNLWWPNGYGPQHLYKLTLSARRGRRELDRIHTRFGIRDLQMLANPPSPEETSYVDYSTGKPVTLQLPDPPPERRYLIQINGRRIFARGANWIPCDLLFGRPRRPAYEHLLRLAARAHFNLLRVWGGGLIEKREFYSLCDELGIMLFQEAPNAGPRLPETGEALRIAARETREILPVLINHPSIVRWGGGNEWYRTRENSRQMAQLRRICNEVDPTRPYHDPDPEVVAQRHGPHSFEYPRSYRTYNTGKPLSAGPDIPLEWTEYGAAGASSVPTLQRIMPSASLWPLNSSDPHWIWHKAFRAFGEDNWLGLSQVKTLFGEVEDLDTLVRCSQFIQAEALRYANQAMRRRKWHLSACAFWVYNEPWPNAAHGCVVEHYGAPKMAYYYVKQSYAPLDVSLVYDDLSLEPGTPLRLPVWVTNGQPQPFTGQCRWRVFSTLGALLDQHHEPVSVPPECSRSVAELSFSPPLELRDGVVLICLELIGAAGVTVARNLYTFGNLRGLLRAPATTLALHRDPAGVEIENTGRVPALFVKLEAGSGERVYWDDNYLALFPGERRRVPFTPRPRNPLRAQAWNSAPAVL
jgi:beta-mannosidase